MGKKIFINLPVRDLKKTTTFFARLGYSFDPQFTSDSGTCMIISDDIFVMFLTEPFFKSFTNKEIPDTSKNSQVILALNADSREAVDEFMKNCIAAGGKDLVRPDEPEFMYGRTFEDPDGHLWEIFYMDIAKVRIEPKAQPV